VRWMLGKPRHKCGEIFNADVEEIGHEHKDWIHLAQHRMQWLDLVT
jgi:hypothetical protein